MDLENVNKYEDTGSNEISIAAEICIVYNQT